MATTPVPLARRANDYPTTDGKPMAETDWHRDLMLLLIEVLRLFYASQRVYVSGNLLVFYEPGNRRRHVSPDVFVVRGVENRSRPNYLVWEEGKAPEVVIELTSSSTRREDTVRKFQLYQDTLRVREYFLFDPEGDHLEPRLQGYRLRQGVYQPIRPRQGRLPSQVLGLHLQGEGRLLRLWNPATAAWLPSPAEWAAQQADQAKQQAEQARAEADRARQALEAAQQREASLAAEVERLRRLIRQNGANP